MELSSSFSQNLRLLSATAPSLLRCHLSRQYRRIPVTMGSLFLLKSIQEKAKDLFTLQLARIILDCLSPKRSFQLLVILLLNFFSIFPIIVLQLMPQNGSSPTKSVRALFPMRPSVISLSFTLLYPGTQVRVTVFFSQFVQFLQVPLDHF